MSGETSGKAPEERQIRDILPSLLSFPSSDFLPELVTGWLVLQEVILDDKVTLRVETMCLEWQSRQTDGSWEQMAVEPPHLRWTARLQNYLMGEKIHLYILLEPVFLRLCLTVFLRLCLRCLLAV